MNYEIKPLVWKRTDNVSIDIYVAKSGTDCSYAVEKKSDGKYMAAYCVPRLGHIILGRELTLEEAKGECDNHRNEIVKNIIIEFEEATEAAEVEARKRGLL